MNEKLIQETMQLIRLSGHVIEGQLMFEPWSDRAMHFIDGLAPQGYSLHAKLPEPLEQELIDWAHKDRHIWALARGYVLRMEAETLQTLSPEHFDLCQKRPAFSYYGR